MKTLQKCLARIKRFFNPKMKSWLNDARKQKEVILGAIRNALGNAYADFLGIKNYM